MSKYPQYSTLFTTIYDQPEPVGQIGRGTHYSVLRSVEWFDFMWNPLKTPQIHDFAVIWDEDHDKRIIKRIEKMYMDNLLAPVQFIGERKGCFTVIPASKFYYGISPEDFENYKEKVEIICEGLSDSWHLEFGFFDKSPWSPQNTEPSTISKDDDEIIVSYLRTIDYLWNLGTKDYFPTDINKKSLNANCSGLIL